jgi:hypothetical protein
MDWAKELRDRIERLDRFTEELSPLQDRLREISARRRADKIAAWVDRSAILTPSQVSALEAALGYSVEEASQTRH